MPSIKDLKKRITSTKNTQQTTKAMKMVSAAKLRRATEAVQSQRPYAQEISRLITLLAASGGKSEDLAPLESKQKVSICIVMSSDRGLCGGYNGTAIKAAGQFLVERQSQGKKVKFVFVGKKAFEVLKGRYPIDVLHFEEFGPKVGFKKASELSKKVLPLFEQGQVDEVVLIYNLFQNAISQVIQTETVLPITPAEDGNISNMEKAALNEAALFKPSRPELYEFISGKYFAVQVYRALLESQASEHGARMSAMENATKNAGDMIKKLTLLYNKQRQASITKELLEIIAGSESQKTQ